MSALSFRKFFDIHDCILETHFPILKPHSWRHPQMLDKQKHTVACRPHKYADLIHIGEWVFQEAKCRPRKTKGLTLILEAHRKQISDWRKIRHLWRHAVISRINMIWTRREEFHEHLAGVPSDAWELFSWCLFQVIIAYIKRTLHPPCPYTNSIIT